MNFSDEQQAISYAITATSARMNLDQINNTLNDYEKFRTQASEKDWVYWDEEIKKLKEYKESAAFLNGEHPAGIDELIYSIIDCRSSIYAFMNTNITSNPFEKIFFFQQWQVGIAYWLVASIGKLVSKDKRDNSLRSLWNKVLPFLNDKAAISSNEEIDYITRLFDEKSGHFTNVNSKAIAFRNKTIAHNESSQIIHWTEIDHDVKILVRAWSIIVAWCSFGVMMPFRKPHEVFGGIETIFHPSEFGLLQENYKKSTTEIRDWCECDIISGEKKYSRSPFCSISVEISFKNN